MFMLIWCVMTILIFAGMDAWAVHYMIEAAPYIGWWPGIYLVSLCSAFLALWTARLYFYARDWREGQRMKGPFSLPIIQQRSLQIASSGTPKEKV